MEREGWRGQNRGEGTRLASGAGLGVSARHCTLFLVHSRQTGHLQVNTFRMPFLSAGPWNWSQCGRPRCSLGPDDFPGVTELP